MERKVRVRTKTIIAANRPLEPKRKNPKRRPEKPKPRRTRQKRKEKNQSPKRFKEPRKKNTNILVIPQKKGKRSLEKAANLELRISAVADESEPGHYGTRSYTS